MIPLESIAVILLNGLVQAIVFTLIVVFAIIIAFRIIWHKVKKEMVNWVREIRKDIQIANATSKSEEFRRKFGW